jgi:hypothetical protein
MLWWGLTTIPIIYCHGHYLWTRWLLYIGLNLLSSLSCWLPFPLSLSNLIDCTWCHLISVVRGSNIWVWITIGTCLFWWLRIRHLIHQLVIKVQGALWVIYSCSKIVLDCSNSVATCSISPSCCIVNGVQNLLLGLHRERPLNQVVKIVLGSWSPSLSQNLCDDCLVIAGSGSILLSNRLRMGTLLDQSINLLIEVNRWPLWIVVRLLLFSHSMSSLTIGCSVIGNWVSVAWVHSRPWLLFHFFYVLRTIINNQSLNFEI